jgi:hypothetical protein
MVYRTRVKYTAAQKAEIWDRWHRQVVFVRRPGGDPAWH